ncbi:hypothetical protein EDB92DRAFT_1834424 [Lactarius akahatsu]|uniref:Uncharacterized protein n=1 Tax=Lactarius akahatsu TaxID=416441 RepID=A0AAD4LNV1_9AGAM|nr:hypothetical protein EDB92DRAFT_1834424 [Lactarius akahatsu]
MRTFTAFDLAHPARPSPTMSPPHSLEWRMVFQPFKAIANRLAHFLSCLRLPNPLGRIRIKLWDFLPAGLGRYRHYRSLAEEQKWWDESARTRAAFFASSDARHGRVRGVSAHGCLSPVPLITSYVPRLLPAYRDHPGRRVDDAASERELTPSVYHKWHRLVYPHEIPPSRREAAKIIRYLSTRDRQEIARIAHLVTDEAAAQKGFFPSPVYQDLWASWLQCKGPDLTIVFE